MKSTGRALCGRILLMLIFVTSAAQAELTASVDRDRVKMGDTLRLTIAATASERIGNLDPRPLLKDFEIVQSSTSNSTSIVNGRRSSQRKVILDITPRRTGTLTIPSLSTGDAKTNFLILSVTPQANNQAVDQTVSFTAELDSKEAYVQSQVILTLRIMQSINLESRSVTDLQLESAFVKQLEQKSFQRAIDGRQWLIHEIRYAIFPEESGTLKIPVQTFTARESTGRRSTFGFGSSGRQVKRSTRALSLNVLPRPDSFSGSTWLPAENIRIEENWSTPPEQLHTGESATRTVRIIGEGLQGAQLPPTLFPATDGLKYYPDQPVIEDSESSNGLTGVRIDSAALIPTKTGTWTIPEVRIPWWDTKTNKVRYAILPEREIIVSAGSNIQLDASPIEIVGQGSTSTAPTPLPPVATADSDIWKLATFIMALGWLATLVYLIYSRRRRAEPEQAEIENPSEKHAFKQLIAACAAGNAVFSRREIIHWSAAMFPALGIHSLDDVSDAFNDSELTDNLGALNNQLYRDEGGNWSANELKTMVQGLRKNAKAQAKNTVTPLQLYPGDISKTPSLNRDSNFIR